MIDGEQHARQHLVDAEQRLPRDDLGVVDARHARTEQPVIAARFQHDRLFIGYRQRRGLGRELPITKRAPARAMQVLAALRRALPLGDLPLARRGGHEQRARNRTRAAQLIPIVGDGA